MEIYTFELFEDSISVYLSESWELHILFLKVDLGISRFNSIYKIRIRGFPDLVNNYL